MGQRTNPHPEPPPLRFASRIFDPQSRGGRETNDEDFQCNERDFIRAEWLIGAAHTLTLTLSRRAGEGTPAEAERHLAEALARDRRIGMLDTEAPILLEFANHYKVAYERAEALLKELVNE
jgi:hypothetical protein